MSVVLPQRYKTSVRCTYVCVCVHRQSRRHALTTHDHIGIFFHIISAVSNGQPPLSSGFLAVIITVFSHTTRLSSWPRIHTHGHRTILLFITLHADGIMRTIIITHHKSNLVAASRSDA